MSKEKEDVEEVDETHQQFGISESEMKKKMRQVVDTWDVTHDSLKSGQKRTQQRVLRECILAHTCSTWAFGSLQGRETTPVGIARKIATIRRATEVILYFLFNSLQFCCSSK